MNKQWLAGFIDGEGCIRLVKGSLSYTCKIIITQNDKRLIYEIQDFLVKNHICSKIYNPKLQPHCYRLEIFGKESIKNMIKILKPRLLSKKQQNGLKIIEKANKIMMEAPSLKYYTDYGKKVYLKQMKKLLIEQSKFQHYLGMTGRNCKNNKKLISKMSKSDYIKKIHNKTRKNYYIAKTDKEKTFNSNPLF